MRNSFFTNVILILSVFYTVSIAGPEPQGAVLTVRQNAPDPCVNYDRIANLSTIGKNSSYRSAFLSKSSVGTMYDGKMFTEAILALPALTADVALNQQCGNRTQVALDEAAKNFTQGIVGPFSGIVAEGIKAGPEVIIIVGVIMLLFSMVWSFQP